MPVDALGFSQERSSDTYLTYFFEIHHLIAFIKSVACLIFVLTTIGKIWLMIVELMSLKETS